MSAAALRGVLGRHRQIALAYATAALLFVVVIVAEPALLNVDTLRSLSTQASFIGAAALGQTIVIISGGIDLSIPWVMSSCALLLATLAGGDNGALIWALPLTLCFGALIGLVNGAGVALLGVSPIIMTLAMNTVLLGGSSIISEAQTGTFPSAIDDLSRTGVGPISIDVAFWILAGIAVTVVLATTGLGRRLYAVGSNPRVAMFSGINVAATRILAYVISAVTAACAGIMVGGFGGQAFGGLGDPYLFASVAAVAVGGAAITGGSGNYVGTVAGTLVLVCLATLLPILGLSAATLSIIYGAVILATVYLAGLRGRPGRSPASRTAAATAAATGSQAKGRPQ